MALTSSCPACSKPVTLPTVHGHSRVRCPLCQSEFLLQQSLDLAPPMLEVVEVAIGAPFDVADHSQNGAVAMVPAMAALGAGAGEVAPTYGDELSFDAPPADDLDGSEEPDTELEGKVSSFDDLLEETNAESADLGELDLVEAPAGDSPFSLGGPISTGSGDDSEGPHFSETIDAPSIGGAAAAAKRRKKEPSFIGNLIGVVGGGVVGCSMAYFIVLWIGGPDKDFLELGPKLPKWLLPSAFSKPTTAAVTPMATNPTKADIEEVKQAVDTTDEAGLKVNVPALPETKGEELDAKLPFDTSTEEVPTDTAAADSPDSTTTPDASLDEPAIPDPTLPADDPAETTEEMPADEADTVGADTPSELVGPKDAPTYTADDVETALDEVLKLKAQVDGGKSLEPAALKKLKQQYFRKMYRLGDVVAFAKEANGPTTAVASELSALSADKSKFAAIGKNGVTWMNLDPAKRTDAGGVFLAGKIEESDKVGSLFRVKLLATADGPPVSIYSPGKIDLAKGDGALVLGSIVTNPKDALDGFEGDEAVIVWHGLSVSAN